MSTTLITDFEANTEKLINFIHQVEDDKLLANPTREEWSIMDCSEHILQLEQALIRLFRGPVEKTDRTPDQHVEIIKTRFLDFGNKLTAFGVILPERKYKTKTDIEKAIRETRKMLQRIGTNNGWEKQCMMYAHPLFGHLTRLEWIGFCIYHVERHLHQMEGILQKV